MPYHPERFFIGCVSDRVVAHPLEPHGPRGEVWPFMALIRDAIGSDVAPDLVKVGFGLGVKIVAGHVPDFALRA